MKITQKYVFWGIVALLFILLVSYNICGSSKWSKKYNKLEKQTDQALAGKDTEIDKLEYQISILDSDIEKANNVIVILGERIDEKDKIIKQLEAEEEDLIDEEETLEVVKAQRDNYRKQRDEWKAKFFLAEQTLLEKDKIIFSLKQKYETQVKITDEWKGKYDIEYKLRLEAKDIIKAQSKQINSLKLGNTVRNVLLGGAVAGLIYSFLK